MIVKKKREAHAAKKRVVYVVGAWAFLHPSHQHILKESLARGDHILVGVHDDETRLEHGCGVREKYSLCRFSSFLLAICFFVTIQTESFFVLSFFLSEL